MIVVSTQCFPPATGGIENLMWCLCTSLHEQGQQVAVYADNRTGANVPKNLDSETGFPIHRYGGPRVFRRWRKARDLSRLRGGPHVLITDSWKSLEKVDASRFHRTLCLVHGTELTQRNRSRILHSLGKADHIIANSAYTADQTRNFTGDNRRITVIHPGILEPRLDAERMQEYRRLINGASPVLITVARLVKRKGHADILAVLPELVRSYPNLLYVIIGDGPERSDLERQVRESDISTHVRFVGSLTEGDKNAWLANADLFVMPGRQEGADVEGFGIAYIEAGWFGVPSVASDSGGAGEAVQHGHTGVLIPPGDREALAGSLRTILNDSHLRSQLGNAAQTRARELLWSGQIGFFLALLKD